MSSSPDTHSSPSEDSDCVFCCSPLDASNYVEYRSIASGPWLPSPYCESCIIDHFISAQWQKYIDNIQKADCAAALRRVITSPPPINVKDAGLPCKDNGNNEEVREFWYASDGKIHEAKLVGSLVGEEREAFWREKKTFLVAFEQQEELDKEKGKEGGSDSSSVAKK